MATGDDPTVPTPSGGDGPTRPEHGGARVSKPSASDRYRLEGEIARGGMGRVVEAFDRELDRRVAIKEALTDDADTLQRFKREIWITARLEHPAIVPLYDAGTRSDGTPFYVMRKIGGRPLVELVEAAKSVEARLALVPHVLAAARAIAHAHQRRVVHRDLKPSNILVGELGETVVIDWGLAKLYGEIDEGGTDKHSPVASAVETRAGTVMGTPGFMAPEQVAGGEADPRVDVYALGATLYYVLARQLPHAHTSTQELLHATQHPATPIGDLVPEVPKDLETIVDVAITPDPAKRFADAGAMVAELERFLDGRLIASRRYTPFERLLRFVERHRVAVITALIAAIALVVGGSLAFDRVLSARGRAERALDDAVHEREVAQDLLATMTLDRARSLVESNPTAAVALVRSLATGPRWREVRAIVAGAEQHGVASSMPGPEKVAILVVAPTAPRAAAIDTYGQVWTYDLETHRATDRGRYVLGARVLFFDDRTLVISEAERTIVLDVVAGTQREWPVGGFLAAAAGHLIVHRKDKQLGELDVVTGAFRSIGEFPRDPGALVISRDGEWIVSRTEQGVAVLERATGKVMADIVATSPIVKWDPDRNDRFVISEVGKVTVVTLDRTAFQQKVFVTDGFGTATYSTGKLWFVGMKGIELLDSYPEHLDPPKGMLPWISSGPHGLAYALGATKIIVLGDITRRELQSPIQLTNVAAAPGNPYVVASGAGRVVVWRVVPPARRLMKTGPLIIYPFGPHGVMFGQTAEGVALWNHVDLATGQTREVPVPKEAFAIDLISDTDGQVMAFKEHGVERTIVISPRTNKVTTIDGEAILGVGGRVALARPDGRVFLVDSEGTSVEVVREAAAPEAVYVTPTTLTVAWANRKLWFSSPRGTRSVTYDKLARHLMTVDDEVILVTGDNTIEVWRASGISPVTTTSMRVDRLLVGDRDQLLVLLQGGAVTRIDRRTGAETRLVVGTTISAALDVFRALVFRGTELEVTELDVGTGWKLRAPTTHLPPTLSFDGNWIAFNVDGSLYAQAIDVPSTAAELAARMDLMTNAEVDRAAPSSVVRWRD